MKAASELAASLLRRKLEIESFLAQTTAEYLYEEMPCATRATAGCHRCNGPNWGHDLRKVKGGTFVN